MVTLQVDSAVQTDGQANQHFDTADHDEPRRGVGRGGREKQETPDQKPEPYELIVHDAGGLVALADHQCVASQVQDLGAGLIAAVSVGRCRPVAKMRSCRALYRLTRASHGGSVAGPYGFSGQLEFLREKS